MKTLVPLDRIIDGGPPKDGIPSIDQPRFVSHREGGELLDDEDVVIGVALGNVVRAYPHKILVWHEIVNERIGDAPLAITYCPLAYPGAVYHRNLRGRAVEFGVSGRLYNSDLLMYDRATESLWSQIPGQAVVGELAGTRLQRVPAFTVRWGDWRRRYHEGEVLSPRTGFGRPYGEDPYGEYPSSSTIRFPVDHRDTRLHPKTVVHGLALWGSAHAYLPVGMQRLGVLNDAANDTPVAVAWSPELNTVRLFRRQVGSDILEFDGREAGMRDRQTGSSWDWEGYAHSGTLAGHRLEPLPLTPCYWFAWTAFYPRTMLLPSP